MAEAEARNAADFERIAESVLDPGAHGYFAGGAGDERTLRENVAAFGRWRIRPRVLVDVGEVTTETTVLGTPVSMPILVAPVAFQRLAHADGEAGMARAAAGAGTLMCLSTFATARPSEIAEAAPRAPRWFQLYCFRDRGVTRALAEEAVEAGYEAIALTVDAPRAGRRERDARTGFAIPPEVTVPSLDAAVSRRSPEATGSSSRRSPEATGSSSFGAPMDIHEIFALVDPSLTWRDLEQLISGLGLPVLVKGVLTAEDARLAADHGAAGVIVSNHGGRQLDGVPASLEALPEVVEAVGAELEVYMDGGVRRGTDALVALALGARAVMVGRPPLWGLAAAGEEGARRVLELLREELELGLCLAGCPSPDAVTRRHVRAA